MYRSENRNLFLKCIFLAANHPALQEKNTNQVYALHYMTLYISSLLDTFNSNQNSDSIKTLIKH